MPIYTKKKKKKKSKKQSKEAKKSRSSMISASRFFSKPNLDIS